MSDLSSNPFPSQHGLAAHLALRRLSEFAKFVWHVVEPGNPLVWNWHLDVMFDALQRQIEGDPEYRKLLINVSPGCMKSLAVSVFAPAWEWLHYPERRALYLASSDSLVSRDSRRTRNIVLSPEYQWLIQLNEAAGGPPAWSMTRDQNEKVNFENTARGFRQCKTVRAGITGERGDSVGMDDLLDAKEVINGSNEQIAKRLEEIAHVIDKVLPSRVNDLATARWTMIMQRLHENDPAARALDEGGWKHINLQMEFDPQNSLNHPDDPRTEAGELMFPAKFPRTEIERLKIKLGPDYDAQYQQDPKPREGGTFKAWDLRYWYPRDWPEPPTPVMVKLPDGQYRACEQARLPESLEEYSLSYDCTFKDLRTSDFVVGQCWAKQGANAYLLDQERDRMDINATIDSVERMSARWPQALEKLIEDKANGPAVVAMLKSRVPGLTPIEPAGGKESRANAVAPLYRAGNVWIPHPSVAPWVADYVKELTAFPYAKNDDQVDTTTQYLNAKYTKTEVWASWG